MKKLVLKYEIERIFQNNKQNLLINTKMELNFNFFLFYIFCRVDSEKEKSEIEKRLRNRLGNRREKMKMNKSEKAQILQFKIFPIELLV